MTWVEYATKNEDKQCLRRDVTEVDVSRRGAGRTCLMFVVIPRCSTSKLRWSRPETNVCSQTTCRHMVRTAMEVCWRGSVVPAKFLLVLLDSLPVEDETSNALVVVWSGEREHAAYHGT